MGERNKIFIHPFTYPSIHAMDLKDRVQTYLSVIRPLPRGSDGGGEGSQDHHPRWDRIRGFRSRGCIRRLQGEEDEDLLQEQPSLITGARLYPYQLDGVNWLRSCWRKGGHNGILADEMGLGVFSVFSVFSAHHSFLHSAMIHSTDVFMHSFMHSSIQLFISHVSFICVSIHSFIYSVSIHFFIQLWFIH